MVEHCNQIETRDYLFAIQTHQTDPLEPMFMEDLAALETLTEDAILDELHERLRQGYHHSFIGDILLVLNPNEQQDIYGPDVSIVRRAIAMNEITLNLNLSLLTVSYEISIQVTIG